MEILEACREEEMVAEFLRGELNSPRFGAPLRDEMKSVGLSEAAVLTPNLDDAAENELRSEVLGLHRGWRRNEFLFESFPRQVAWHRARLQANDLSKTFYTSTAEWEVLSGGTYSPLVTVRRIQEGKMPEGFDRSRIAGVVDRLVQGETFYRLLTVGTRTGSHITILEGGSRLTAYLLNGFPDELEVIHGVTDIRNLMRWPFFPSNRLLT